jgi:hypothetical protein
MDELCRKTGGAAYSGLKTTVNYTKTPARRWRFCVCRTAIYATLCTVNAGHHWRFSAASVVDFYCGDLILRPRSDWFPSFLIPDSLDIPQFRCVF